MTVRLREAVFAALLGLVASGCLSSTAPSPVSAAAGTYTLISINGSALPLLTVPSGLNANCTGFTDSGTLALASTGYDLSLNAHFVCSTPPINYVVASQLGTWSETGGQVVFVPGTNVQILGLNLSAGTLNGSTLTLSLDLPSYAPSGVSAGRATTVWRK